MTFDPKQKSIKTCLGDFGVGGIQHPVRHAELCTPMPFRLKMYNSPTHLFWRNILCWLFVCILRLISFNYINHNNTVFVHDMNKRKVTLNLHAHLLSISNSPRVHDFGLWEVSKAPGGNPHSYSRNMATPHRKDKAHLKIKPTTFLLWCDATHLATVTPILAKYYIYYFSFFWTKPQSGAIKALINHTQFMKYHSNHETCDRTSPDRWDEQFYFHHRNCGCDILYIHSVAKWTFP